MNDFALETDVEESAERGEIEAEYALERPVRCCSCKETVQNLHVVRLLRTRVNFTSNLPRRGLVITCPACSAVISASIGTRVI